MPNNIRGVFTTDVGFLFTTKGINNKSMSFPNGSSNKMNKREEFYDKFISLQRHRTKCFYMTRSFYLQYIYAYIYHS